MSKLTLEQIQQSVDTFDLTQSTQILADAWIMANSYQAHFKPTSEEHKLLTKFKSTLDKERRSRAKPIYLTPAEEERKANASRTT